ncbi:MAG: SDR family NAD(P)-dependent oxidoreductase [Burkholderiales bacterium]|nr:SDR family NAD(P)-dependent oxidoreductase [Burkholderiales bacterium]
MPTARRPRHWWQPLNPRLADWPRLRVWIVGASSGIGRATAQELHARGATVYASARSAAPLGDLARAHPGLVALPADACDAGQLRAVARQVLQEGPLDLVMYCAGTYAPMRATAFDLEVARHHQDVNYVGALNLLDAVLPAILGRGGHISLVSSVAGYRGLPDALAYGPTKAALIQLAEILHLELRDLGIGVSVVNPGFVDTPLTAQNRFRMPALQTPEQAAQAIVQGWERGDFEIHFPRRFTLALKLLRLLPFRLYEALVKRRTGL